MTARITFSRTPLRRSCHMIARGLEKFARDVDVEVDQYLPGEDDPDVDCVINVRPARRRRGYGEKFASLYYVKGELSDGDVQVSKTYLQDVKEVLKDSAKSCKLEEVHEHDLPGSGFPTEAAFHVHLKGCSIPDLGKVLLAGGY